MIAAAPAPAPARQPRRRSVPSQRDQQLYVEYQTSGITQVELAEKYELTQCRISQIIRRVAAWRGGIDPSGRPLPEGQLAPHEQQRLDRWLERERNEAILKAAFRKIDLPQITTTTKTGPDGQLKERAVREQPPNVQYLKVAQRANEQLFRREQLEPPPVADTDEKERQQILCAELVKLREAAQASGQVTAQSDPHSFVHHLLRAVQGESPQYGEEDQGLVELGDRLLWRRAQAEEDRLENERLRKEMGLPPLPRSAYGLPERPEDEAAQVWAAEESAALESASETATAEHESSQACPTEAHSSTCPNPNESAQAIGWPEVAAESPCQKTSPRTPEPDLVPPKNKDDAAERRRLHLQKLEQLKEARRRGLPIQFEFDPADGPLPPVYYHVDGVDYP